MINNCQSMPSYQSLVDLVNDGSLNEFEECTKSTEYIKFVEISNSEQFEALLARLKSYGYQQSIY